MTNVQFTEFSSVRSLWSRAMTGTHEGCSHPSLGNKAFDQQAAVYSFKYIHFGSKPVTLSKNGLSQLRASRRAQD